MPYFNPNDEISQRFGLHRQRGGYHDGRLSQDHRFTGQPMLPAPQFAPVRPQLPNWAASFKATPQGGAFGLGVRGTPGGPTGGNGFASQDEANRAVQANHLHASKNPGYQFRPSQSGVGGAWVYVGPGNEGNMNAPVLSPPPEAQAQFQQSWRDMGRTNPELMGVAMDAAGRPLDANGNLIPGGQTKAERDAANGQPAAQPTPGGFMGLAQKYEGMVAGGQQPPAQPPGVSPAIGAGIAANQQANAGTSVPAPPPVPPAAGPNFGAIQAGISANAGTNAGTAVPTPGREQAFHARNAPSGQPPAPTPLPPSQPGDELAARQQHLQNRQNNPAPPSDPGWNAPGPVNPGMTPAAPSAPVTPGREEAMRQAHANAPAQPSPSFASRFRPPPFRPRMPMPPRLGR